jgi:hypothetical protein
MLAKLRFAPVRLEDLMLERNRLALIRDACLRLLFRRKVKDKSA